MPETRDTPVHPRPRRPRKRAASESEARSESDLRRPQPDPEETPGADADGVDGASPSNPWSPVRENGRTVDLEWSEPGPCDATVDREVERHRRPPEADAARKSRGNLGRTAGGEQAAVMRTGCRRGQNLCRVRTVGTTHAIRINRSGETPEAARPRDDTGETGDGARSPPQGSSRRSRRSTRG